MMKTSWGGNCFLNFFNNKIKRIIAEFNYLGKYQNIAIKDADKRSLIER